MDFDKISLTKKEIKLLKLSKNHPVPIEYCARLIRFQLIKEEIEPIPGYQGKQLGICKITEKGMDYLIFYSNRRFELWLKNAWIPIIVSFATTVLVNYILPRLPLLIEWFCRIFSKILS